ncbi:MAG TPA: DMT family transporter [Rhizobiaceae bacterium]|nr:DMT family transporter [Rhizobiaceae bacterium]
MSQIDNSRTHMQGVVLIVASTAFFALAGIFTKTATTDAWTIACWRGFVGSIAIAAYVYWRGRATGGAKLRLGLRGWALAIVGALSSLAFIASFKYTYVANVAIIYATVPFMAAPMEWLTLGQRVRPQTLIVALVSLAGIAVMVQGGFGSDHLFGDLIAVLMTFGCAIYLVMIRAYSDVPVVWAAAVSAFLLFVAGWFIIDPLDVSLRDALVMSAFGLSFAAASILWTEGARLIPAAEAGLLGAAEVPLAILFAWLILSELPPSASIIGGAIVLTALFVHTGRDALKHRKSTQRTIGAESASSS